MPCIVQLQRVDIERRALMRARWHGFPSSRELHTMYIATSLITTPHFNEVIYTIGRRSAGLLMQRVVRKLHEIPGFNACVMTRHIERLVLDFGNGDIRSLSVYPG